MKQLMSFVIILSACIPVTTKYTPANTPDRPMTARAPESVEVFSSGVPSRPFRDVGLLEVYQGSTINETADMIQALRVRAANQGCDALILKSYKVSSHKTMTASCVLYTVAPVTGNR